MARPTQTRLSQSQGYGPDQGRSAPSLGVVAPLNVRTGPSGAELLAQSLGVAFDAAAPVMLDKIKTKAADSAALGRADASLGKADAKRQAEDQSYAFGVKRGLVDRAIVDFKSRAKEFYLNEFDKSQGTEVLAQELDGIAKGMLQNYTGDADAARWMVPEVMNTVNQITGAHDQELANQFKEDRIASAAALVRDAVENQQPIDPQSIMDRLRPILGGKAANEAYVEMVGSLAVEMGSPELIDALIPEQWTDASGAKIPGPRSVDGLNSKLTQFEYYAQAKERGRESELSQAAKAQAERVTLEATVQALLGADPTISLLEAVKDGVPVSDADIRAIRGFARSERDDARDQSLNPVTIAKFRAQMIDSPKSVSTSELVNFIGANYAPGKDGAMQANMLIDDFVTAQNAANRMVNDPLAKAYRESLVTKFKPSTTDDPTPAEKNKYAEGMLAFDRVLAGGGDAEAALKAANVFFEKTKVEAVRPTGNVANDIKAFTENRMPSAEFIATYGKRPGAAEDIARRAIAGEISREAATAAINALKQK